MNRAVLLVLALVGALAIEFEVRIDSGETQCFYEQIAAQAKYNVEVVPKNSSSYEFTISAVGENSREIFKKTSDGEYSNVRISKYAPELNYYSFCILNLRNDNLDVTFKLLTGLELMELEILPNKTDNQYIDREVTFLEEQHNQLFISLEKIESAKQATNTMQNLMSTKIIGFGVIGFFVIIVVNCLFYREVKKTLHERKMI